MKRSDGVLIKSLDPFVEIIPYIMEKRSDAQNFAKHTFPAESIDSYILEKENQGYKFSYLHVFIAAYVKMISQRPQLNRFIMNSRIYQRDKIYVSMAIKHSLRDDGEETTVKFEFTGNENIFQVAEIIDKVISNTKKEKNKTDTDRLVSLVMSMPGFIKKILVKILKTMDKYNILPESIIKVSPFHTTLFFTYLKSINTNYIYHHLYDFGTTGFFAALGKTVKLPIVVNDQVVIKKCCQVGYTMDERICDGLYFARSFKILEKYFNNPSLLETPEDKKIKAEA